VSTGTLVTVSRMLSVHWSKTLPTFGPNCARSPVEVPLMLENVGWEFTEKI